MPEPEQTYDESRARRLEEMLIALSERIRELHDGRQLLDHAGELMRLIGDVRSELFHYEVRATYDTPEIAESRRIIAETNQADESEWRNEWKPGEEDEPQW